MGLNIRVIRVSERFARRSPIPMKIDNVFYITEGYNEKIDTCEKKVVISFCPFCSTKLHDYYKDAAYVQEVMDV